MTTSLVSRERSQLIVGQRLLELGRRLRRFTRSQLVVESGFSQSTITHAVHRLIDAGHFRVAEVDRSGSGRPVSVLEYDPGSELTVVVNLNSAGVAATVLDFDGTVIDQADASGTVEEVLDQVVDTVLERSGPAVRSVVLAVPGVTSRKRGRVTLAPSLAIGDGYPLGAELSARVALPVFVDNDVNLMAMGEAAFAPDQPSIDTVFFFVGEHGIGTALVLGGEIHRGRKGAAGEIGFLPVLGDEEPRGGVGPFEREWSESGIAARASTIGPLPSELSVIEAITEAAENSPDARHLLESVEHAWGLALLTCVCVVAPRQLVLAGAAARLGEASLERIRGYLAPRSPAPVALRLSRSGERGLLLGALRLAHTTIDKETHL